MKSAAVCACRVTSAKTVVRECLLTPTQQQREQTEKNGICDNRQSSMLKDLLYTQQCPFSESRLTLVWLCVSQPYIECRRKYIYLKSKNIAACYGLSKRGWNAKFNPDSLNIRNGHWHDLRKCGSRNRAMTEDLSWSEQLSPLTAVLTQCS